MPPDILRRWNADPRAHPRPALDQPLRFQPLQCIRHWNHAHSQISSEVASRDGTSESQFPAQNGRTDLAISTARQTDRGCRSFHWQHNITPLADRVLKTSTRVKYQCTS